MEKHMPMSSMEVPACSAGQLDGEMALMDPAEICVIPPCHVLVCSNPSCVTTVRDAFQLQAQYESAPAP